MTRFTLVQCRSCPNIKSVPIAFVDQFVGLGGIRCPHVGRVPLDSLLEGAEPDSLPKRVSV